VGGIRADLTPGALVIPDQIIDYTWGREHTFAIYGEKPVYHLDFTRPYCPEMRNLCVQALNAACETCIDGGIYAAIQGPRLETAAEINRMERDGCTIVGMTGMPEAALARELGLRYATCAVVANRAAGKAPGEITMAEIERNLVGGMERIKSLLARVIPTLGLP
jgi:5'-methylthioinosine phosphorylase